MTVREALDRVALQALASYDVSGGTTAELVNQSENATYAVRTPEGDVIAALRVHRLDYHPEGAIRSELCWIDAHRDYSLQSKYCSNILMRPRKRGAFPQADSSMS